MTGWVQVLYSEPGQHNPHAARAQKKRAKREKARAGGPLVAAAVAAVAGVGLGGGAAADEAYDFDEAFGGGEEAMDSGEAAAGLPEEDSE